MTNQTQDDKNIAPNLNKDQKTGRFIAGNKFWLIRSSHGRNPIFSNPDQLWTACTEYFEWVENNPLIEAKAFAYEGEITMADIPKMRAMTIDGLCLFLDIDRRTWLAWRSTSDFSLVVEKADNVIRSQKFGGAAAGLLNANIIARDLGLSEKVVQELVGANGGPIEIKRIERVIINPKN